MHFCVDMFGVFESFVSEISKVSLRRNMSLRADLPNMSAVHFISHDCMSGSKGNTLVRAQRVLGKPGRLVSKPRCEHL